MAELPLVSLIIPAYKTPWFEAALHSALAQDYPHCEIIIRDDCPYQMLETLSAHYLDKPGHSLRYVRNETTLGAALNYEQAINDCRGQYIKFLDDDDLLEPHCVSRLVAAMEAHPDAVIATARRQVIDPQGQKQTDQLETAEAFSEDTLIRGEDVIRLQGEHIFNVIGGFSSVLLRRDDLLTLLATPDKLFELDGELMFSLLDLTTWIKLLRHGNLIWLHDTLSSWRVSRQQITQMVRDKDSDVLALRAAFPARIAQLGWAAPDAAMSGCVMAAPLLTPTAFTRIELRTRLEESLLDSQFRAWFNERTVSPAQQQLLDAQRSANPQTLQLVVVIDATNAAATDAAVAHTLASLPPALNGVIITTLVLSPQARPADDVASLVTDSDGRWQVLNAWVEQSQAQWVMVVLAGVEFLPSGVTQLSLTLPQAANALALYGDEIINVNGYAAGASFRPDINLDLLLSSPSTMSSHWLFRRELIVAAQGFASEQGDVAELDLILRLIESQGLGVVSHMAEPLLVTDATAKNRPGETALIQQHLQRRGYPQATVQPDDYGNNRIDYQHADRPLVSVIILAEPHAANLAHCLITLMENTAWPRVEVLIVADNSREPQREEWLAQVAQVDAQKIRVLRHQGSYNRSMMANTGTLDARGDYLLFINSSLAVQDRDWLHNLMNQGLRAEVGVVGGRQLTGNGEIYHAGFVLGINGPAGHAFQGQAANRPGHMGRQRQEQNYSAVSGDFMLVRKAAFIAVNGYDAAIHQFDDVDLCLRIQEQGLLVVWTPYASALRLETDTPPLTTEQAQQQFEQDEELLYQRWMPVIARDPAYNINLSMTNTQFDIAAEAARNWRPLHWKPLPSILAVNADRGGCGYYRIMKPLLAMEDEGVAEGSLVSQMLPLPALAQYQPDSLIIQRQYSAEFHHWMARVKKLTNTFKVYELDDYLPNLPIKSTHRGDFKQDIKKQLRKSLSYFDRFVVSTEPLAEAFAGMHPEIVVMPNRLPLDWWGNLHSQRRQGRKPRIGWAGGASHRGDLEMIADVVKAFANDVEWVFLGMCPQKLRPWVHEFHPGTDIDLYPAKLASLNLDLALAPVEDNLFNACKSNLRLLEYGACAYPVIASDIVCYRGGLPVTLVRNRFKDWCDAIRMHLDDPLTSEQMGRALHDDIKRDWMLTGEALQRWAQSWTSTQPLKSTGV